MQPKNHQNKNIRTKRGKRGQNPSSSREVVTRVPQSIGYPDRTRVTLRYCDLITVTTASPQYTFRGNALFDPDFTSTGHQPMFYDQFIAVYQRYRVFKTGLTVRVVNTSATVPAELVCVPASNIPTATSLQAMKELPRAKASGILPVGQAMTKEFSLLHSTDTIIGVERSEVITPDYAAQFNAVPVELWYYSFAGFTIPGGSFSLVFDVEFTFMCEFFDRAPVSISIDEQIAHLKALKKAVAEYNAKPHTK